MHHSALDLNQVIVFLAVAGLIVPIMLRFRISPVLGFLAVGLAIGPFGLGRLVPYAPWLSSFVIEDIEGVRAIAELGVVFLLFMIGLELTLERLLAMRRLVFGLGGLQVTVTACVIFVFAWGFGNTVAASIVIGACLALSSTAIVMQLLIESRRLGTPVGQASFSILLFQDLAVVPILFLVGVLGEQSGGSAGIALALAILKAVAVITFIIVVGRLVVRPLFGMVGATHSRELFMAALLLVVIGTAVATEKAGLSLALGAFLAGLLLAETQYRHQIEVDIEPFKGLLMGLFFVSVGMSLDLAAVLAEPFWLPISVIGLFAVKSLITYALARAFGMSNAIATESALLLGQGGEFAFIVISLALSLSLLPNEDAQFFLVVTIMSMLITPFVAKAAKAIGARLAEPSRAGALALPDESSAELAGHVVIAGYGRVGELMGNVLEGQRIPHVGIDLDAAAVTRHSRDGRAIYFGDASNPEILRRVGIENASAFVVTMDSSTAADRVVRSVHEAWPKLPIIARARDTAHAKRLLGSGAGSVVPETVEASLDLAEVVMEEIGVDHEASRRIIAEHRERHRSALKAQETKETTEAYKGQSL